MDKTAVHTFVVCAYRESPFLEECIKSLLEQTVRSTVVISTSTPNASIDAVAARYGIPVFVNRGKAGITGDWNFGVSLVQTPYFTIAHQDDVYEPTYAETVLNRAERYRDPILVFSDYFEIRNGERVYKNKLLKVKKLLNLGFRPFKTWRWMRRRVLSFGNSICCPAVTYCTRTYGDFLFDEQYRFACDGDAWERLSRKKGAFVYIPKPLMGHRIHEGSETTKQTADTRRGEEEFLMFRRFWPEAIARRLSHHYADGAKSNQL